MKFIQASFFTAVLVLALNALTGCVNGTHVLVASDTNIGMDIDTKPPHADINIGRKEAAIVPGFEGGQTVPTVMGFQSTLGGSLLSKLAVGIGTVFSTGHAAVLLVSQGSPTPSPDDPDGGAVTQRPEANKAGINEVVGTGQMRALAFGTQTSLGLHLAWDGTTSAVPSEFKLGFNRKEGAYAPIGYEDVAPDAEHPALKTGRAVVPSTLASLDTHPSTGVGQQVGNTWVQWFATGRAAEHLAARDEVRQIMLKKIDPEIVQTSYNPDANSERIKAWIKANPANRAKLAAWMTDQKMIGGPTELIHGDRADDRAKAIKAFSIP
jgi:hypothetical protein